MHRYIFLTPLFFTLFLVQLSAQQILKHYAGPAFTGKIRDMAFLPNNQLAVLTDSAFCVVSTVDGGYLYQNRDMGYAKWNKPKLYKFNKPNDRLVIAEPVKKNKEAKVAIWLPDRGKVVEMLDLVGFNSVRLVATPDSTSLLLTEFRDNPTGAQIAMLDLKNFEIKWRHACKMDEIRVANRIESIPVYDSLGSVLVAAQNGLLFKVRLRDGITQWVKQTRVEEGDSMLNWIKVPLDKYNSIVKCSNGNLEVLEAETGNLVTAIAPEEGKKIYDITVLDDTLVVYSRVAGYLASYVNAYDRQGKQLWKKPYKMRAYPKSVVYGNGILYIISSSETGSSFYCGVKLQDGTEALGDSKIPGIFCVAYRHNSNCVILTSSKIAVIDAFGRPTVVNPLNDKDVFGSMLFTFAKGKIYFYIPGMKCIFSADSSFLKIDGLMIPDNITFNAKEVYKSIEYDNDMVRVIGYQSMVAVNTQSKTVAYSTPLYPTIASQELVSRPLSINISINIINGRLTGYVYIPVSQHPYASAHLGTVNTETEHICIARERKTKSTVLVVTDKKTGTPRSHVPYTYNKIRYSIDSKARKIAMIPYPNAIAFYAY